ncbi:MAG: hypothetical protein HY579_11370 [Nitrospinae bacterium]|nr:hypothetical protein [Nitrospinota bacterium]
MRGVGDVSLEIFFVQIDFLKPAAVPVLGLFGFFPKVFGFFRGIFVRFAGGIPGLLIDSGPLLVPGLLKSSAGSQSQGDEQQKQGE